MNRRSSVLNLPLRTGSRWNPFPFHIIGAMETEKAVSENVESLTPELDADLPQKGIPRLIIEKLVLENFKSYAGVKVGCMGRF